MRERENDQARVAAEMQVDQDSEQPQLPKVTKQKKGKKGKKQSGRFSRQQKSWGATVGLLLAAAGVYLPIADHMHIIPFPSVPDYSFTDTSDRMLFNRNTEEFSVAGEGGKDVRLYLVSQVSGNENWFPLASMRPKSGRGYVAFVRKEQFDRTTKEATIYLVVANKSATAQMTNYFNRGNVKVGLENLPDGADIQDTVEVQLG